MIVTVKIDELNRVVVATAECPCGCGSKIKAIAKCSTEDIFNVEFGIRLAKAKLYHKLALKRQKECNKMLKELTEDLAKLDKYKREISDPEVLSSRSKIDFLIKSLYPKE